MSKPKILHFILDGFSPSNEDDPWDCFKDIVSHDEYHIGQFVGGNPDPVDHPRSPDMWTRAYSKVKFEDIEKADDNRIGIPKRLKRVPTDKFIWNVLSKEGIPSWIYPYGQYYHIVEDNMLNENSQHVNGIIKRYSTNLGYRIHHGEHDWYRSPIGVYYGMHEMTRESYFKDNHFSNYREEWKNPSEEFLARVPFEMHDFIDKVFDEYLEINTALFQEEILPHLHSHVDDFKDGGYVHIGLVESDVPMHFALIYPDIMAKVRTYLEGVIQTAVSIVNPDILIITGDHGMRKTEDYVTGRKMRKPVVTINYNGQSRIAIQANFGISPIYTEHSHDIGAMFYVKDESVLEEFDTMYFNNSPYLMFDIYDFVIDTLTK